MTFLVGLGFRVYLDLPTTRSIGALLRGTCGVLVGFKTEGVNRGLNIGLGVLFPCSCLPERCGIGVHFSLC